MQSYDEILQSMTDKYTELSGITPFENSDIGIRLRVVAGEIYSSAVNLMWLKRQMFVSTAQGEYLDMHAKERGLLRREATPAFGEVTFSVSEALSENVSIPKGTIVATFGSLLRFETTKDAVLFAGELSVTVSAKSIGTGREYNVLKGKISVMITPPAGIDLVENSEAFTGGCDAESDESLRERIQNSIRFPANSTNCAYYEALAEGVNGVSSASAVALGRGSGTVDVYIAGDGSVVSDETLTSVQRLLSKEREVNVDVLVKKAQPSPVDLYLEVILQEGYGFDDVKDRCRKNISDFIAHRGVGAGVRLCQVSEIVYHTPGVKAFNFVAGLNGDFEAEKTLFPVPGTISIIRGSE